MCNNIQNDRTTKVIPGSRIYLENDKDLRREKFAKLACVTRQAIIVAIEATPLLRDGHVGVRFNSIRS